MAIISESEDTAVVTSRGILSDSSYVDWPAILAGAVLATSISFVFNAFGAGIGLTLVSPYGRDGIGGTGVLIAIAIWVTWVTVSSFMAGGYLTGRLRRRANDASEHEVDVRDGAHGLAVWAAGVMVGAVLLASGIGTTLKAGADAASGATNAAMADGNGKTDPMASYLLGSLLRPAVSATPGSTNAPSAGLSQAGIYQMGADNRARRDFAEIFRVSGNRGAFAPGDKAYMTTIIASGTGLTEEQASTRVDTLTGEYLKTRQEAKEAVETARKTSVVAAFVLAASLLIGGAGACWAAMLGGRHRDEQTVIGFFGARR